MTGFLLALLPAQILRASSVTVLIWPTIFRVDDSWTLGAPSFDHFDISMKCSQRLKGTSLPMLIDLGV